MSTTEQRNDTLPMEGYLANRCVVCKGHPIWTLTRQGDVAVAWADSHHLVTVLDMMQFTHRARTEILVTRNE